MESAASLANVTQEGLTSVTYNIASISSRRELEEALNISASGSFGGVSASASFSQNVRIDQFNAHALVQIRVMTPPQLLTNIMLSEEAVALYEQSPDRFRRVCGDSFVVSIVRGGELNGLFTVFSRTEEERRQFQASASGSFGAGSFSGSVGRSFRDLLSTRSTNVRAFYRGTDGSIETLFEFAASFPGQVFAFSTPYAISVRSYDAVINFPSSDPLPRTVRNDVISDLYAQRLLVMGWRDDVAFVIESPELFVSPALTSLVEYLNSANGTLNDIERMAMTCIDSLSECARFEEMIDPPNLPEWQDTSCIEERSSLCGVELFSARRSEVRGVNTFNEASGPPCGVSGYRVARTAVCGAEVYSVGQGSVCGGLQYPIMDHRIAVPLLSEETTEREARRSCEEAGYVFLTREEAQPLGQIGMSSLTGRGEVYCFQWRACRHPTFGSEQFNACAHPDHGIIYSTCRNEAFGVEAFNECRDPSHGVDLYRSCSILSDESGICPI